jgi:branched-chain amino acid transport system substrate-binding protein
MKRGTKLLSLLAAGMLFAALIGGCGGSDSGGADKTVKVGGLLEMTGGSASFGISSKNGIDLAFKDINAKGGVLGGKKLELVVADTKSEASEATNGMQKLISQDGVAAVIGPNQSSAVIAASAINNGAKVLGITPMGTNPDITVNPADGKTRAYNYRACFIDPFQGTVMASFAYNDLGVRKAAVLVDNTSDYSKGLAKFFTENFANKGGSVVIEEAFLQKDTDFKSTLTKIKVANPDFIYIPGYYQEVGLIIKQARELGINVPIAGGDGWDSAKLPEIAGKAALNNTYFSSLYSSDEASEMNKKFVEEYQKEYNTKPDVFAALAYDSALLVAKAIEDAKSAEPAKIAEAMSKISGFKGVSGDVVFDEQHNPIKSAVIIEYVDGAQTFKTKVNP